MLYAFHYLKSSKEHFVSLKAGMIHLILFLCLNLMYKALCDPQFQE